jgi:hypothetical protein
MKKIAVTLSLTVVFLLSTFAPKRHDDSGFLGMGPLILIALFVILATAVLVAFIQARREGIFERWLLAFASWFVAAFIDACLLVGTTWNVVSHWR